MDDKTRELQELLRDQAKLNNQLQDRQLEQIARFETQLENFQVLLNALCRHGFSMTINELVESERARLKADPAHSVFGQVEPAGVEE